MCPAQRRRRETRIRSEAADVGTNETAPERGLPLRGGVERVERLQTQQAPLRVQANVAA